MTHLSKAWPRPPAPIKATVGRSFDPSIDLPIAGPLPRAPITAPAPTADLTKSLRFSLSSDMLPPDAARLLGLYFREIAIHVSHIPGASSSEIQDAGLGAPGEEGREKWSGESCRCRTYGVKIIRGRFIISA